MDINNDELRRELRDLDKEHREVMPKWRDSLRRLMDDKETPTEAKADLLLGGFNRRRFMNLSGLAVVAAPCWPPAAATRRTARAAMARRPPPRPPRPRRRPPPRPTRRLPGRQPRSRTSPSPCTTRRS